MAQQKSQRDVIMINGIPIPIDTPPEAIKQILLDPSKLTLPNGRAPEVPIDLGQANANQRAAETTANERLLGGRGARIGPSPFSPEMERDRKFGIGIGRGIQVAGQAPFLPLPIRLLASGLGGFVAGSAQSMGGTPEQMLTGGTKQAMIDAGLQALLGGVVGGGAPRAGYKVGMALGGVKGDTKQALEAYMREREQGGIVPGMGLGITLGNKAKTGRRIDAVSKELQNAEEAIPGHASLGKAFRGSTSRDVPKSMSGAAPLSDMEATKAAEERFLREQTVARAMPPAMLERGSSRDMAALRKLRPSAKSQDASQVNARQLGQLKRDLFKTNEAQSIFNQVVRGEYVPSSVSSEGKAHLSLANSADKAQEALDLLANKGKPTLAPINSRLSDLFTIKEVNDTLRGGGGVLADVGQVGMRGGLGAGLAKNVAAASGTQGGLLERLGGGLGIFTLAPRVMSGMGSAAGRLGELTAMGNDLYSPFNRTDLVDIIQALRDPTPGDPRFTGPPKRQLQGVSFRGKE